MDIHVPGSMRLLAVGGIYSIAAFGNSVLNFPRWSGAGHSATRGSPFLAAALALADTVYLPPPDPVSRRQDAGTRLLLTAGSACGLAIGISAVRKRDATPSGELVGGRAAFFAGTVIGLGGVVLRLASMRHLGRSASQFAANSDDAELVVTGPYRFVRHPAYAGALLQFVGCGLALGTWRSVAALTFIPFAARIPRLLREESALRDRFGSVHAAYARSTPLLVPRLRTRRPNHPRTQPRDAD